MVYRKLSDRKADEMRAAITRDWMTLTEAMQVIGSGDALNETTPQRAPEAQIFDAIEHGELRARWLDEAEPYHVRGFTSEPDHPFFLGTHLQKKKRRFENGGEISWGRGRWRQLLLLRADVTKIFRQSDTERAGEVSNTPTSSLSNNPAGKNVMREAISTIYDLCKEQGVKPPNVREIPGPVVKWLRKYRNVTAPNQWIADLAGEERFQHCRGRPGITLRGSLCPVSMLKI